MKNVKAVIGSIIFWIGWPVHYLYLHDSHRTRLLLVADDKILFLRGLIGTRKLGLPGGGKHTDEIPQTAAIREAREEVGIDLNIDDLKPIFIDTPMSQSGIKYNVSCYSVNLPTTFTPKIQKFEVIEALWLPWKQLINSKKLSKTTREILNAWIENKHLLD